MAVKNMRPIPKSILTTQGLFRLIVKQSPFRKKQTDTRVNQKYVHIAHSGVVKGYRKIGPKEPVQRKLLFVNLFLKGCWGANPGSFDSSIFVYFLITRLPSQSGSPFYKFILLPLLQRGFPNLHFFEMKRSLSLWSISARGFLFYGKVKKQDTKVSSNEFQV
jgi:hypothetical protein